MIISLSYIWVHDRPLLSILSYLVKRLCQSACARPTVRSSLNSKADGTHNAK